MSDENPVVVIAAAGRARRFGGGQKVLAQVGGIPSVCRVARACDEGLGAHRQLVVIGHEGERVRAALGEAPHRQFVRQEQPLGTGDALVQALSHLGEDRCREVYFLCGDKPLISPESLSRLQDGFRATGPAMAFLTGEVQGDPAESRQGRVIRVHEDTPRAQVVAIVERAAIDALGDDETISFRVSGGWQRVYTRDQLLALREVNVSAYLWRTEVLREHIGELALRPESGEYLVTDLVDIFLQHRLLVCAFPVSKSEETIGIDTPDVLAVANEAWEELQEAAADTVLAAHAGDVRVGWLCADLLKALEEKRASVLRSLTEVYGSNAPDLLEERRQACSQALRSFLESWGNRRVRVFRAPGRIALNPHCEHQGAWVPYGTHARELLAVVAPRHDDTVTITNVDASYQPGVSFRLRDEIAVSPRSWQEGWLSYIEDARVARQREALADPRERVWGRTGSINFVKAAALRLAREASEPVLGADIVINGNIPVGMGQSSSSALVVATAVALSDEWKLGLDRRRLASICGEAEWYVGTRGGSGDHAAMLLGSAQGLVSMCFEPPVTVRETRPMCLPPGFQIIIANSGQQAIKNKEERRQFNAGIFAYRFALLYLRDALSVLAEDPDSDSLPHDAGCLGEINIERLPLQVIYRLLRAVPETTTPRELIERYSQNYEEGAHACFGTADPAKVPVSIPVRGAALYGLGRVDRGLAMHQLCAAGDGAAMREFGRMMCITHDGDRVTRYDPREGRSAPYSANLESVSDARIDALIEAAGSDPGSRPWRGALPRYQSGFYGASTPELDRIVDLVMPLPAVLGAGLMGAGGGGCVLVLTRRGEETMARMMEVLEQGYYEPLGVPVDVEPWHPTGPAGPIDFALL